MDGNQGVAPGVDPRLAFGACAACRGRGMLPGPVPHKPSALAKWERKVAARAQMPPGKSLPPLPPRPAPPPPPEPIPCSACAGRGVVPQACAIARRADEELSLRPQGNAAADVAAPVASRSDLPLIAIVGGGLGGLACALALQQRGARVAVFERDGSFEARAQGYGLTIQQVCGEPSAAAGCSAGQAALLTP